MPRSNSRANDRKAKASTGAPGPKPPAQSNIAIPTSPATIERGTQTDLTGVLTRKKEVEHRDSASVQTLIADNSPPQTYSDSALSSHSPPNGTTEAKDNLIVGWNGPHDPEHPQNFSKTRKWVITVILGLMTICVTFASSVFSTATKVTAEKFKVSQEVMVLATSLFVLGFAFGPIIFGPMSELYGRKRPLFAGLFIFAVFQIPVAVSQNLQTIFICRFIGGLFASAPLAIASGILADLFGPVERGIAVSIFAGATFIGPVAGPIVGGFITISHLGWRWTEYITAIMAFFFSTIGLILIPETFEGTLLTKRAWRRRFETKNWALHAKAEERKVDIKDIATRFLIRPFIMLGQEPILLLITLYMGFIYGFLYLCFEAYPISFQEVRGWNDGVGALPFVSITVGVIIGCAIIIGFSLTRYRRILQKTGKVNPEERLIPMMIGGILLPIGMFWFAWTSSPGIIWVPQALSGVFLGAGVLLIFLQGLNYIIDVYTVYANSAIAANSFFRSWLGAVFPLFASAMFHNLGVNWAMTLLGILTGLMFPVPVAFFIYGPKIRSWSKFSVGD
ncbi:MFS multidrug transporter [Penicillium macrosclerotiorum]|uniref:MFS multidrug transporter n=1 Tax=Penicillium macrosclerotiorum TaxID=303699 RepID=UPI002546F73A|nr:MFS multidrug transporter [Penicillium macrosclerotiorum]KAJ5698846.1 MFS multidrug transporter [Penicillium macrosclerotiorum]